MTERGRGDEALPHPTVGVFESVAALRLLPLGEDLEHEFTPGSAAAGRARTHWQTPHATVHTGS